MSIFRNPNEVNYTGGRKHWTDVIKDTGPVNMLLWKQPEEDFNTNSTLIVMPGEQAIFVHGGEIEQVFGNGRYKLSTENYPFISRLRNAFSGGISTFNCVVYFVRTAHTAEIYWGTDTPIQVRDPYYGIQTSIRARGTYKAVVENAPLMIMKMIGSREPLTSQEDIDDYFAGEFQQYIRSAIAGYIASSKQDVLTICGSQADIAAQIGRSIAPALQNYGLRLTAFSVSAIEIPQDDPNRTFLEESVTQNLRMNMMGDNWEKIQRYNLLNNYVNHSGGSAGMDIGALGAQIGIGSAMGDSLARVTSAILSGQKGGFDTGGNNSAPANADSSSSASQDDDFAVLQKLKKMLDAGLIPQEAYDAKMKEILDRM